MGGDEATRGKEITLTQLDPCLRPPGPQGLCPPKALGLEGPPGPTVITAPRCEALSTLRPLGRARTGHGRPALHWPRELSPRWGGGAGESHPRPVHPRPQGPAVRGAGAQALPGDSPRMDFCLAGPAGKPRPYLARAGWGSGDGDPRPPPLGLRARAAPVSCREEAAAGPRDTSKVGLWRPLLVVSANGRPVPLPGTGRCPSLKAPRRGPSRRGPRPGSPRGDARVSPRGPEGHRRCPGLRRGSAGGAFPRAQATGSWSRSLSGAGPLQAAGPQGQGTHPGIPASASFAPQGLLRPGEQRGRSIFTDTTRQILPQWPGGSASLSVPGAGAIWGASLEAAALVARPLCVGTEGQTSWLQPQSPP